MTEHVTIGTRGSALALVQAHWVRGEIIKLSPHLDVHVLIIQTSGDKSQAANTPLSSYSEKGIFAKELEVALLDGEIDVAVHSMKDMASTLPDRLHIAAVPMRQDARDAIVGRPLAQLRPGDRVGTGSVRRSALIRYLRPDLNIVDIRGNVDTRIGKLKEGQYESIVLAVAGLNRLGRSSVIDEVLDPNSFVPDPGQGALAIQTRVDDLLTNKIVAELNHDPSFVAITAERAFLAQYGGGCQTPVGAWATVDGENIRLTAMAALDGTVPRYTVVTGSVLDPVAMGKAAAQKLLSA